MKKQIILFASLLALSTTVLPTATVLASETQSPEVSTVSQDNEQFLKELQDMQENNPYVDVEINGDEFTLTFTDKDVYEANGLIYRQRAAGTNKVTGNWKTGNVKVYVSAGTLNAVRNIGGSALGFLVGGVGGFVINQIVNIANSNKSHKHGRVFVYTSFRFSHWYYQ